LSLIRNTIKKATFVGKGRYYIPVIIIKFVSGSDYYIKNLFDYKNLKKDKNYNVDYYLLNYVMNNYGMKFIMIS
jgi:hypothetical protein